MRVGGRVAMKVRMRVRVRVSDIGGGRWVIRRRASVDRRHAKGDANGVCKMVMRSSSSSNIFMQMMMRMWIYRPRSGC